MRTTKVLLTLIFLLNLQGYAQVNDAGLWINVCAEKKLTPKIKAELSHEFRFNENISELGTSFTEIGGEYKINKRFTVGLFYRYIQKRQLNDFYLNRHRSFIDISYRKKVMKIAVTLRQRMQAQFEGVQASSDADVPEYYMRTKLSLKADFDKKYAPFISGEIFYPVFNVEELTMDNFRIAAGVEYEFNKRHSVTLSYLLNKEVNVNDAWTEYISSVGYKFSF